MKDAFGNPLAVGDRVMFGINKSSGTLYSIGKIVKLYPYMRDATKQYSPPDRVGIHVTQSSTPITQIRHKYSIDPILYTTNVVNLNCLIEKNNEPVQALDAK